MMCKLRYYLHYILSKAWASKQPESLQPSTLHHSIKGISGEARYAGTKNLPQNAMLILSDHYSFLFLHSHPVFADGSFFAFRPSLPRPHLHSKRYDIVSELPAHIMIRPDNFFPAHRTFGRAFAGIRSLILSRYQCFHEAAMAEEMAFKNIQVSRRSGVEVKQTITYHNV